MKLTIKSSSRRVLLSLAVATVFTLSFGITNVGALSNIAPDQSDYSSITPGNDIRMEVSAGSLNALRSTVYIYSKTAKPKISIIGANHCYSGILSANVDASSPPYTGKGVSDTTFSFFVRGSASATPQSFSNSVVKDSDPTNPNSACNSAVTTKTFSLGSSAKMPASTGLGDYYQIKLVVDLIIPDNSTNSFKVQVDNGIVSYTNISGNKFAIGSRPPADPNGKTNYNLYFATPCNATGSQLKTMLSWFDADQNDYSQTPSNFYFNLLSRPRGSTGSWSTEISKYSNVGGNDQAKSYNFTFSKEKEYNWQWVGVSDYNGIQFQIPFDSAYAKVTCAPPAWSMSASSTVNGQTGNIEVGPGTRLTFSHTAKVNSGKTTVPVNWSVQATGQNPNKSGKYPTGLTGSKDAGSNNTIIASGIGSQYCQNVKLEPGNSKNTTISGNKVCATVVAHWAITPRAQVNPVDYVNPGQTAQFTHVLTVSGGPTDEVATWTITGIGITTPQTGTFPSKRNNGSYTVRTNDYKVPLTAMIGSTICQKIEVHPASFNHNPLSKSSEVCVKIIPPPIKPQAQVLGYDARVGQKVSTSLTIQGDKTTGSWTEYAALSGSNNSNFASSRGLDGGSTSSNQSSWSSLTFANSGVTAGGCATSHFGCYGTIAYPSQLVTALRARCSGNSGATIGTLNSVSTTRFICVNGTAWITGNIKLASASLGDPSKLPQVVIIANNIIIDPTVTRIDAWLIAGNNTSGGNISTCSSVKSGSNYFPGFSPSLVNLGTASGSTNCPNRLLVTGPVVAGKLYLYRTSNPGTSGNPAETFNTRADAFLWAYSGGGKSGTPYAQTTMVQELPPRF